MKILALDIGEKRIGVARADTSVRIAVPLGTIEVKNAPSTVTSAEPHSVLSPAENASIAKHPVFTPFPGDQFDEILKLCRTNRTNYLVLGLPRSNQGQETAQSRYVRAFAAELLKRKPDLRIAFEDESLTSVEAEARLKARKKTYAKGDIDAEAATIILQDFLERSQNPEQIFASAMNSEKPKNSAESPAKSTISASNLKKTLKSATASQNNSNLKKTLKNPQNSPQNTKNAQNSSESLLQSNNMSKPKRQRGLLVALIIMVLFIVALLAGFFFTRSALEPVSRDETPQTFIVAEGETPVQISQNLETAGLIKNSFIFSCYYRLTFHSETLKSGTYSLSPAMTPYEILSALIAGAADSNTFSFTINPGENIFDIKQKLQKLGFSTAEIETAFAADYDYDFLPDSAPTGSSRLEGYLYGDTYEFYLGDSVETILNKFLSGMQTVISDNDLESAYENQGLTLHQGIILASIVQKEAYAKDMPFVAQVFLSRLSLGMALGSDVTVSYALDVANPSRNSENTNNSAALTVDSCYNTRLYTGLPCGPIASPSLAALEAVANPSDTSYLYFLTGDDGLMYYSYTEAEHNQNIADHCQVLCNTSL